MNKRIAAITMARNDEFFLSRWIAYYGSQFGFDNLYIYLDGLDQKAPTNAHSVNIEKLEHKPQSRQVGDKTRILLLSKLANKLFNDGYDIVIGCDCDEFLILDPNTNKSLAEYLSNIKNKTSVSGLGMDVGQNLNSESELNPNKPFLFARDYAVLSTRYTKPVVLFKPAIWGSGFHSVKGRNFNIDKNLYLLHFGNSDLNMIKSKIVNRDASWEKHLNKRTRTINMTTDRKPVPQSFISVARLLQTILRPVYDLNKPAMMGLKWVVKIPKRFKKIGL
jgi:hypothetical protein